MSLADWAGVWGGILSSALAVREFLKERQKRVLVRIRPMIEQVIGADAPPNQLVAYIEIFNHKDHAVRVRSVALRRGSEAIGHLLVNSALPTTIAAHDGTSLAVAVRTLEESGVKIGEPCRAIVTLGDGETVTSQDVVLAPADEHHKNERSGLT